MSNCSIVTVNAQNIKLLKNFIDQIGTAANTFRYFNKRTVDVINNHLVTLLLLYNNLPVAYGHLEPENKTIWLGICVLPGNAGKGFGKLMMSSLIEKARELNISSIDLTVDKVNIPAINLYEKFAFNKIGEANLYYTYQLLLY